MITKVPKICPMRWLDPQREYTDRGHCIKTSCAWYVLIDTEKGRCGMAR